MRISIAPGPTLGIGFQSGGSSPNCTAMRALPALLRASFGKSCKARRLPRIHESFLSDMICMIYYYAKFCINRQQTFLCISHIRVIGRSDTKNLRRCFRMDADDHPKSPDFALSNGLAGIFPKKMSGPVTELEGPLSEEEII
jgi:hypothetical protein